MNKTELRKYFLAIRAQFSKEVRETYAGQAAEILAAWPLFLASSKIACYYPMPFEFDTLPIIQAIWQHQKHCYLPVLPTPDTKHLAFAEYEPNDVLTLNRLKIPEPTGKDLLLPESLDVVIAPLVAFDVRGGRLGMGGGYYDYTFQFLKLSNKPTFVGLGFSAQEATSIPQEPFDVALDFVLTEKKLLAIS